LSRCSRQ